MKHGGALLCYIHDKALFLITEPYFFALLYKSQSGLGEEWRTYMRDFQQWLDSMTNTVASWEYYTDFPKVYRNVNAVKVNLNILNSLIGSSSIYEDFIQLVKRYPETLSVIPLLIAKRMKTQSECIIIRDTEQEYHFNFNHPNYSIEEYAKFMEKTGLFELISKHLIANLVDYVLGVEVGLDSNGRKNRTGHAMENIVEDYLIEAGFKREETLFKEIYQDEVEQRFNVDLSSITNEGKTAKRFDFVAKTNENIYLIETNFYSSGGSKLNEVARSYKLIAKEAQHIPHVHFVWITDGQGWTSARKNLLETFEVLPTLYNLHDLKQGVLHTWK